MVPQRGRFLIQFIKIVAAEILLPHSARRSEPLLGQAVEVGVGTAAVLVSHRRHALGTNGVGCRGQVGTERPVQRAVDHVAVGIALLHEVVVAQVVEPADGDGHVSLRDDGTARIGDAESDVVSPNGCVDTHAEKILSGRAHPDVHCAASREVQAQPGGLDDRHRAHEFRNGSRIRDGCGIERVEDRRQRPHRLTEHVSPRQHRRGARHGAGLDEFSSRCHLQSSRVLEPKRSSRLAKRHTKSARFSVAVREAGALSKCHYETGGRARLDSLRLAGSVPPPRARKRGGFSRSRERKSLACRHYGASRCHLVAGQWSRLELCEGVDNCRAPWRRRRGLGVRAPRSGPTSPACESASRTVMGEAPRYPLSEERRGVEEGGGPREPSRR